jgi:hypothetical protein
MKTASPLGVLLIALSMFVAGVVLTGCKSTPKIDWQSRVGIYTFDQAIAELGPPDKTATLSDGRKVADWVERSRGSGLSFGVGTGFSSGGVGMGVGQSVGSGGRERVLRLTFDAENRLISWHKNY